jgi:O-antigen/teichoic acid export membrane protein
MSRISTDLAADVAGRAWTALLGLFFPPVYAALIGVEGYGLIGFFTTVTTLFVVLDLGLARTITRELAVFASKEGDLGRARDLVRTLEALIWGLGFAFGVSLCALAPLIAQHWLGDSRLPTASVIAALRVMGLVCIVSWPVQMYGQMLLGLRRQALASLITTVSMTARSAGAAAVLWFGPRTVATFFAWTLAVTAVACLVLRHAVMRSISPEWSSARVRPGLLLERWQMSLALWVGSAAAVSLAQLDRVVGSSTLGLRDFGYYSLAAAAASGVQYLSLPVWNAVFPRLCQLGARTDAEKRFFGLATQVMAALVIPTALVLAASAHAVLFAWTGRADVAISAAPILSGLAVSTMFAGLSSIPLALLVARGHASTPMIVNLVSLGCSIPVVLVAGATWGGSGLAWAVATAGACSFAALSLSLERAHAFMLLRQTSLIVSAAIACIAATTWSWGAPRGRLGSLAFLAVQGLLCVAVAVCLAPDLRERLMRLIRRSPRIGAAFR